MDNERDWHLVTCAQAGDMNAFAQLVRDYQNPVIHFCHRMLGSTQDAEDIAQETFVRVFRHLPRLKPNAKFSTFLFTVARNLSLNALRDSHKYRRHEPVEQDIESKASGPDGHARANETQALVERALATLSPDHREVLLLREMQGMDYDEIARVISCRIGTVKSRLARARDQLRTQLTSLSGGEL